MRPAVSYGAKAGYHWMAFLYETAQKNLELGAARYDNSGKQVGDAIYPLGKGAHFAISRPAIAYSSKSNLFLVTVAERVGSYDRVAARFFDGDGKLLQTIHYLFDDGSSTLHMVAPQIDVSPLRIAYNSLLDEFLVTAQRTVSNVNGVWAQRISYFAGLVGAPAALVAPGTSGIASHAIAFAPIAGTQPAGGRYLLAYGYVNTLLLDSQGNLISVVPLDLGVPKGGHAHPDIAYGVIQGKERFLVVYGDDNNCQPGTPPCQSWTGVWGTYIVTGNPAALYSVSLLSERIFAR